VLNGIFQINARLFGFSRFFENQIGIFIGWHTFQRVPISWRHAVDLIVKK